MENEPVESKSSPPVPESISTRVAPVALPIAMLWAKDEVPIAIFPDVLVSIKILPEAARRVSPPEPDCKVLDEVVSTEPMVTNCSAAPTPIFIVPVPELLPKTMLPSSLNWPNTVPKSRTSKSELPLRFIHASPTSRPPAVTCKGDATEPLSVTVSKMAFLSWSPAVEADDSEISKPESSVEAAPLKSQFQKMVLALLSCGSLLERAAVMV